MSDKYVVSDDTTAKDFILSVAQKINKTPQDVSKYIDILEENWIENAGALRQMDDEQWKSLNIPLGLVNIIKKHLTEEKKAEPEMMQIDSTVVKKEHFEKVDYKPVLQLNKNKSDVVMKEEKNNKESIS